MLTDPFGMEASAPSTASAVLHAAEVPSWGAASGGRGGLAEVEGLASASGCDGVIFLWPIEDENAVPPCARSCVAHFDVCTDHVVDWDHLTCLSVGADLNLAVSDLSTGKVRCRIKCHEGSEAAAGRLLCVDGDVSAGRAVAGTELHANVVDLEAQQVLLRLHGHLDDVVSVQAAWARNQVVSISWDRSTKIWDLRSGRCAATLEGHDRAPNRLSVDFELQLALSCADEGQVILWDLRNAGALHVYDCGLARATDVCVDWGTMTAAACGLVGGAGCGQVEPGADAVVRWSLEGGDICAWSLPGAVGAQCLAVDWRGNQALVGCWDSQVLLLDLDSGERLKQLKQARRTITRVHLRI